MNLELDDLTLLFFKKIVLNFLEIDFINRDFCLVYIHFIKNFQSSFHRAIICHFEFEFRSLFMSISRLIFSLKMRLRSGFRYGESSHAVELYRVVDDDFSDGSEDDFSDGSEEFPIVGPVGNDGCIQRFSVGRIQVNRVTQIVASISSAFQTSIRCVRFLSSRVCFFVIDGFKILYHIAPTILGIVGGVVSIFQYCSPRNEPMHLYVEIDGELFAMNKVNKTN